MSASVGLLGYFILEASELVERLDAIVGAAGAGGPDGEALTLTARKLRGSATMAKLSGMTELGAAIERVGRALRDGGLSWTPVLRGALVAAVDDVRTLLRAVRAWSPADDARAAARVAELSLFTPHARLAPFPVGGAVGASASTPAAGAASAGASNAGITTTGGTANAAAAYVANGASEAAVALEAALGREGDRAALVQAMGRVRALRGLAEVREITPVNDVVDALDQLGKSAEQGVGVLDPQERALVVAAAASLRRAAADLRERGTAADAPEHARFGDALHALDDRGADVDRVVPVASLFFEDAGPHVIARAPNPPTTPAARFRMEAVSLAEHLGRAVDVARAASTPDARERAARELRRALGALGQSAASFGEEATVRFVRAVAPAVATLAPGALDALDDGARLLAQGTASTAETGHRLDELATRARETPVPAAPVAPPTEPPRAAPAPAAVAAAAAPAAAPTRSRTETPTGRQLHALLQTGIVGIDRLNAEPLSDAAPLDVDGAPMPGAVVPIERLLYRGRSALARARELRDGLRARGAAPSADDLAELYDLLDLAAE